MKITSKNRRNKDSSGPILDFYISDSMQDMLDIDIRSEIATVVGGTNEFSSTVNDLPSSLDLDFGSNDGELSWLNGPKWSGTTDIYADVGACVNPNSVMPLITSSLLNSSKSQLNLNATTATAAATTNDSRSIINNSPPLSPKENKSHLTFSPHQIKVPPIQENRRPSSLITAATVATLAAPTVTTPISNQRNSIEIVKKDLTSHLIKNEKTIKQTTTTITNDVKNILPSNTLSGSNTIKLAPGIGGLTFSNSLSYNKLKQANNNKLLVSNNNNGNNCGNIAIKIEKELSSSPIKNGNYRHQLSNGNVLDELNNLNGNSNSTPNSNKFLSRSILVQNSKNITTINNSRGQSSPNSHLHNHNNNLQHHNSHNKKVKPSKPIVEHEYPKPAYSYSCLITMALKNSRSGSLPVSEIYSFMCEHFPYFKTAPNGWKNSVRHNLSLNKCFEKIEKPVTNGGQRKGCLWAMNPSKITKMDEEVQKWSRKDPMAIRKAMVYPEHLEALERGEMKHGSTGDSDNDGENDTQYNSEVEENSDSEPEPEHDLDDNLIETPPESMNDDDESDEVDNKEYEVEIRDVYDAIDIDDGKDAIQMAIQRNNLLGFSEEIKDTDYSLSKRARLDINYSISSTGSFEQKIQQQRQQHSNQHNRRKMQLVNRIA